MAPGLLYIKASHKPHRAVLALNKESSLSACDRELGKVQVIVGFGLFSVGTWRFVGVLVERWFHWQIQFGIGFALELKLGF
jgi:hypothetical protein